MSNPISRSNSNLSRSSSILFGSTHSALPFDPLGNGLPRARLQGNSHALDVLHARLATIDSAALHKIMPEDLDELVLLCGQVQGTIFDLVNLTRAKKLALVAQIAALNPAISADNGVFAGGKPARYYVQMISAHVDKHSQQPSVATVTDLVARSLTSLTRPSKQKLKDLLLELKQQCQYQSLAYLLEFISAGGVDALLQLLSVLSTRKKHAELETTLKILRMIANHHVDILTVLAEGDNMKILVECLDSPLLTCRTAVLDFMLAIATMSYPEGHALVMQSLRHLKQLRKSARVFDVLVDMILQCVSSRGVFGTSVKPQRFHTLERNAAHGSFSGQGLKATREFLAASIAFCRFIVEITPEFEYRMHIRSELLASNLSAVFSVLYFFDPETIGICVWRVSRSQGTCGCVSTVETAGFPVFR